MKPFSQACENNKKPILAVLRDCFASSQHVLEIGSGTGQHGVYFAAQLKELTWQMSDREENHLGINLWREQNPSPNLPPPKTLDVRQSQWPEGFDAVYSANTAHIMPWDTTQIMIEKVAQHLPISGKFVLYGPFNYRGSYTSESNYHFDIHLKNSNPSQGIRDFEKVNDIATAFGLILLEDLALPANNRLIIWQKT